MERYASLQRTDGQSHAVQGGNMSPMMQPADPLYPATHVAGLFLLGR